MKTRNGIHRATAHIPNASASRESACQARSVFRKEAGGFNLIWHSGSSRGADRMDAAASIWLPHPEVASEPIRSDWSHSVNALRGSALQTLAERLPHGGRGLKLTLTHSLKLDV